MSDPTITPEVGLADADMTLSELAERAERLIAAAAQKRDYRRQLSLFLRTGDPEDLPEGLATERES
ncbi:hypothetical protein FH608_024065 [Nonomuraea phyllanthi]|uniref:Uncharacterized protein n=1 Tax=Nonomuraea phyllanthi TaxID=2219224 RepID=A0A5C4W9I3_9ACTN|nr:hypothetical protein [Nonomuraea phyllanthi]KAB8192580.1 hypothetical protein FH608_024065 [Nonomuraea phyllanthi]